eukprot:Tamp_25399.p1 GENE.Tamp_25399~~Tamp_25399.p1  ORF type:complete len:238 (-),score=37.21 Tamp_25399:230-898(-)
MARPPPPGYHEAVRMPGRAYEGYVPPSANAATQQAVHHCECPICFEPMHGEASGVLAQGNGSRSCAHFFHQRCLTDLLRSGNRQCPLCRASFTKVLPVPSLEANPAGWFKVVDLNGDGGLSQQEIKFVLLAQLPIDEVILEEELNRNFKKWDKNKDGFIRQDELLDPNTGLIAYVRNKARAQPNQVPDIKASKEAWFRHYDDNGNGTLQQDEVHYRMCSLLL